MKLLLASGDADTAKVLALFLTAAGHMVERASDLDEAGLFLNDGVVDLAVLDCAPHGRLPAEISALKKRPPILAICDPLAQRKVVVDLLNSGADDALALPVDGDEFLARLLALHRRATGSLAPLVEAGRLSFEPASQTARVDGRPIHLTGKERHLFEALIMRAGLIFTKEHLLNALYGGRDEAELKIIDVFICKLRRKIAAVTGGDGCILTVWGRGYMIPKTPGKAADEPTAERAAA